MSLTNLGMCWIVLKHCLRAFSVLSLFLFYSSYSSAAHFSYIVFCNVFIVDWVNIIYNSTDVF